MLSVARMGEIGTWDWDIANTVVLGESLRRMFRLRVGSFAGDYGSFIELIHPDDRERFKTAVAQTLNEDAAFAIEYRVVVPSGSEHALVTRADLYRDKAGKPARMTGVCIDLSARKMMEKALHETEQRLDAVLDHSTAGIFVKDLQGRYTLVNRAFGRSTGGITDAALGKTDHELFEKGQADRNHDQDQRVLTRNAQRRPKESFSAARWSLTPT